MLGWKKVSYLEPCCPCGIKQDGVFRGFPNIQEATTRPHEAEKYVTAHKIWESANQIAHLLTIIRVFGFSEEIKWVTPYAKVSWDMREQRRRTSASISIPSA